MACTNMACSSSYPTSALHVPAFGHVDVVVPSASPPTFSIALDCRRSSHSDPATVVVIVPGGRVDCFRQVGRLLQGKRLIVPRGQRRRRQYMVVRLVDMHKSQSTTLCIGKPVLGLSLCYCAGLSGSWVCIEIISVRLCYYGNGTLVIQFHLFHDL
jgi:hypothetical protein